MAPLIKLYNKMHCVHFKLMKLHNGEAQLTAFPPTYLRVSIQNVPA